MRTWLFVTVLRGSGEKMTYPTFWNELFTCECDCRLLQWLYQNRASAGSSGRPVVVWTTAWPSRRSSGTRRRVTGARTTTTCPSWRTVRGRCAHTRPTCRSASRPVSRSVRVSREPGTTSRATLTPASSAKSTSRWRTTASFSCWCWWRCALPQLNTLILVVVATAVKPCAITAFSVRQFKNFK